MLLQVKSPRWAGRSAFLLDGLGEKLFVFCLFQLLEAACIPQQDSSTVLRARRGLPHVLHADTDASTSFHISGSLWLHWTRWMIQNNLPILRSVEEFHLQSYFPFAILILLKTKIFKFQRFGHGHLWGGEWGGIICLPHCTFNYFLY